MINLFFCNAAGTFFEEILSALDSRHESQVSNSSQQNKLRRIIVFYFLGIPCPLWNFPVGIQSLAWMNLEYRSWWVTSVFAAGDFDKRHGQLPAQISPDCYPFYIYQCHFTSGKCILFFFFALQIRLFLDPRFFPISRFCHYIFLYIEIVF